MVYTDTNEMVEHMKRVNKKIRILRSMQFIIKRDEFIGLIVSANRKWGYKKYRSLVRQYVETEMINRGELYGSVV